MLDGKANNLEAAPVSTFDELEKNQFLFDWRNDPAHSVAIFNKKSREKFLQLVENWLSCQCLVHPDGATCLETLRDSLRPLPLLEGEVLKW